MGFGSVTVPGVTVSEMAEAIAAAVAEALESCVLKDNLPTAADIGAVPTGRKVNGKALTGDITLTAADVGTLTAASINAAMGSKVELGARTQIPANADLNNAAYLALKGFAVNSNAAGATIKNSPVTTAFILDNFSSVGSSSTTGAWRYLFQRMIGYGGGMWVRASSTNGSGVWSFGAWQRVAIGDYLPLAGGTLTGRLVAQNNTAYTTKQVRNTTLSTAAASGGANGDMWFTYA